MNLYEIDSAIMNCVDMETGEIIDMEALENLQMERDQKIENIGCWIKNLLADAKALKEEKDNLAARQKSAENKVASLKAYLSSYLNGEKFKTAKVAISYRKSDSVDISEGAVIPDEYLKYSDPTPDKIGLKAELKAGEKFPGISIVTSSNIQIK